ncbi:MAG TPA: hypothetical protein VFD45_02055 [Patescibacteria group bacterium]|nr:hypothetical protein [Patescibacteria group bacterium]
MINIHDKTKKLTIESYDKPVDNGTFKQDIQELKQKANSSLESPSERGSNSISGSTPDLESDDDVLQSAHQMGIAQNADFEHPTELNIAKDINDAENSRKAD